MAIKINKQSRDAIRAVVDALFERAKARLLGRHSNSIYYQIVRDFGIDKSIEGTARHAASIKTGSSVVPDNEIIQTQADEVRSFLGALKEKTTGQIFDAVKSGDVGAIKDVFAAATNHVEMIIAEETNRAKGLGIVDAIDQVTASQGLADPTIFAIGPLDAKTCPACLAMYHCASNPKIPRVYKRSQLSMAYFKKKTWDGKTIHMNGHPNCRHSITVLMPGFGFNEAGHITYMGQNHDEYKIQQARGDT